uniref:Interferon gamma receptor 1 n=1 Tax=Cyprinus carpio TaxID=7962 RepID=A0A8C1ZHL0_CYPCA
MRTQIYITLTVWILIKKSASEVVSLPSPVNVSVQCGSYGVKARWEYPDLDQDVYFQVKVKDESSERSSNLIQNRQLNISSMLFNAAHNRYCVSVTAMRGGEKSDSTNSVIFSYNTFATADIKCYLDFPEVKLSPKDGKLHVQFTNPLLLYRNSPALRNLTDNLEYCIKKDEGKKEVCETCEMKQNTSCETSVVFSSVSEHRGKYCINLTGKIGQRYFNPTRSCFIGDIRSYPSFTVYLYPGLGVVLTLLFITAGIILLAKKCNSKMKKKVPSMFPHFFDFGDTQSHPPKTLYVVPDYVESHLQIEDNKEQTSLISLSDNKELESSDSEDKNSYGPNDLVEDEQSDLSDFYDCPHAPRQKQEMSPGDLVDGYGA